MDWIAKTAATRLDVRRKLPTVRTVIVVARNYYTERPEPKRGAGRIARYAWGRDYHRVLRRPLIQLARFVDALGTGTKSYASVDAGPVLERAWAQRAGVAAIGKHSLGLRRDIGSWFFLATILTDLEMEPDAPAEDVCGTCTLCMDACPTQAIVEPRVVDARRCISYQTIENGGAVPREIAANHGAWVFGCDICQEVCPWNRFAKETTEMAFHPKPGRANPSLSGLITLNEDEFHAHFAGSAVRRAKRVGMKRNARIASNNLRRTKR
jgi:epoxyqueuosine reductase